MRKETSRMFCIVGFWRAVADEELNDLKSELIHQQQKVDEFSALKDELDQAMGEIYFFASLYNIYCTFNDAFR